MQSLTPVRPCLHEWTRGLPGESNQVCQDGGEASKAPAGTPQSIGLLH